MSRVSRAETPSCRVTGRRRTASRNAHEPTSSIPQPLGVRFEFRASCQEFSSQTITRETRELIASLLVSDFDVVATVSDGQLAVEAVATLQPDLVVLDITMPVLGGFAAAAKIRNLAQAPRIVFLTAHEEPALAEAAAFARRLCLSAEAKNVARELVIGNPAGAGRAVRRNRPVESRDVNRSLLRRPDTCMRCSSMKIRRHSRARSGASSRKVSTPISLGS